MGDRDQPRSRPLRYFVYLAWLTAAIFLAGTVAGFAVGLAPWRVVVGTAGFVATAVPGLWLRRRRSRVAWALLMAFFGIGLVYGIATLHQATIWLSGGALVLGAFGGADAGLMEL